MIGPHLVDLAAVARHRLEQRFLSTLGIVAAGCRRRQVEHRRRQIGEETPGALERLLLGVDGIVDAAGAGLDVGAAKLGLAQILAEAFHHRRTGDEHRGAFGHDRIMAGGQPRRAEARDRTEPERDHGHAGEVSGREPVRARAADAAGQVGRAARFDRLHRAAAARPFDHANDRQAKLVSHFLGHQRLGRDRSVGGTAAHRKIVTDHDHGAAVDPAAAEHAVGRRQLLKFIVLVVFGDPGNGADLMEGILVDQSVDALTNREPALVMLALDLVNASHLARERFAPSELVELRLPVHSYPPS